MVPALKNMVMVMRMLMKPRPLSCLKIRGYAHSTVMVSDSRVHTTVRNTVQKKARMYLGSFRTVA